MASGQQWRSIQKYRFHVASNRLFGKWGKEEGLNQATLSFKFDETRSWLARSTDGASIFGVERMEISGPRKDFTTRISDLLLPERLDGFVRCATSEMGIPNLVAGELRTQLSSYVNEKVTKANAQGRCIKILSISVGIKRLTDYWFDDSWMINAALRESQNLNYNTGFGAVPATEAVIASALSTKIFKKDIQESNQTCIVCLDEFVDETEVSELSCLHIFHGECIRGWLRQSNCCPVCRFKIQEEA